MSSAEGEAGMMELVVRITRNITIDDLFEEDFELDNGKFLPKETIVLYRGSLAKLVEEEDDLGHVIPFDIALPNDVKAAGITDFWLEREQYVVLAGMRKYD
jgi:hypothetical protein